MSVESEAGSHEDDVDDEEPAVEAELIKEELRIDGICGVY